MKVPKYIISYSKYISGSDKRMTRIEYETADSKKDAMAWYYVIKREPGVATDSIVIEKNTYYGKDNDKTFKKHFKR